MSETEKRPPRPRPVTLASVMAVVGSLVLVVSLVDTLGRLRTPETRRSIDDFLAEPPGDGLGMDTGQVVELMRALAYASAVLAAVTLVLGVYVAQRHHGARIGLTVAAGLLLLTVPVAGLMPFFVAVAVGLLWSRPARDWFAGRPAVAAQSTTSGTALSEQGPPPSPFPYGAGSGSPDDGGQAGAPGRPGQERPGEPPTGPPAWQAQPQQAQPQQTQPEQPPYPQQPPTTAGAPWQQQPPPWQGYPAPGWPPAGPGAAPAPGKRPATVTTAAVLTWLGAGATAALAALAAVVVAVAPDAVVDEFDRIADQSGTDLVLSRQEVLATAWTSVAIMLVWSLAAILLAVMAFRRSNVGRILLTISAAMTALFSLVSILSIFPAVTLLMGIATVVLLYTGGANAWYRKEQPWQQPQWGPPPGRQGPW